LTNVVVVISSTHSSHPATPLLVTGLAGIILAGADTDGGIEDLAFTGMEEGVVMVT
jgi:hypothetical protein